MSVAPQRKCNHYDPDTSETCCEQAAYIVALDIGEPGDTGVLSCFRCEEHKDSNGVQSIMPWEEWYVKQILGATEQSTDWDLE